MRTLNFRDGLLFPAARKLGMDPTFDLAKDAAAKLIDFLQNWLADAWDATSWPQLNLTEERAFRRIWYNDEQYVRSNAANFNLPDEVFYITSAAGAVPTTGDYYQVNPTAVADPPVGTLPTDTTYFTAITDYDRFLELDQPGKQAIGDVIGIYSQDPGRTNSGRSLPHEIGENGIEVYGTGGATVWVRYRVRPPKFTANEYDNTKAYVKGDVLYDGADGGNTGECYLVLGNTTGNKPPNVSLFQVQPVPEFLAQYAICNAAADYSEDAQTKADYRAEAERAFQRQSDRLLEQGRDFARYRARNRNGRGALVPGTALVAVPASS